MSDSDVIGRAAIAANQNNVDLQIARDMREQSRATMASAAALRSDSTAAKPTIAGAGNNVDVSA